MPLDMETLKQFASEPDSAGRGALRLRGLRKIAAGVLGLISLGWLACVLGSFVGASPEVLIPAVFPPALTALVVTCIGGLQALTGRAWGDCPPWARITFLIVTIPAVLFGIMGAVALLASA